MAKKVVLTENEILYIKQAAFISNGVFDFENTTDESFKEEYGLSKEDAYTTAEVLFKRSKGWLTEIKKAGQQSGCVNRDFRS